MTVKEKMAIQSAKDFWKSKFDEYPQSDADKLSVAMMAEYASQIAELEAKEDDFSYCQKEIEEQSKCKIQCEHCKEYYKPLEAKEEETVEQYVDEQISLGNVQDYHRTWFSAVCNYWKNKSKAKEEPIQSADVGNVKYAEVDEALIRRELSTLYKYSDRIGLDAENRIEELEFILKAASQFKQYKI